jgi:thiol-disulfide isomerase/thioredoxin
LFVAAAATGIKAQTTYKTSVDSAGNKVLTGKINEKILANDSSFRWFYSGVNSYKPDPAWTKYISFYRDSFKVVVFAGTWCNDSKRLVPQFYRVMLASSYPMDHIQLYGVDHQLRTLGDESSQYGITKTPTFIFLHNGKEIGRIAEKVQRGMDADIVSVLQGAFSGEGAVTSPDPATH